MAKLADYADKQVRLIGLNLTLAENVRRNVWVVFHLDKYAVAAFGDYDVMFFNAQERGYYWNSTFATEYATPQEAVNSFRRWYHE